MSTFRRRVAVWPNMSPDRGNDGCVRGAGHSDAPGTLSGGLTVRSVAWGLLALVVGCATTPSASGPDPQRVRPAFVLDQIDLSAPMSPEQARSAQEAVREARLELGDALTREEIACYRTFLTRRCLDDLGERRRAVNERLNEVEVSANQRLRDEAARSVASRQADEVSRRQATLQSDTEREAKNRQEFEARLEAARQSQVRREAEAPEIARRTEALRQESERKERVLARRREEALRRQAAEAGNVAERTRAIEANRQQQLERQARQAQQEARRQRETGNAP